MRHHSAEVNLKDSRKLPFTGVAAIALLSTVLAACGTEKAPGTQTSTPTNIDTSPTATAPITPGVSESPSPSAEARLDFKVVNYPKNVVPPVPTNYGEAIGFFEWLTEFHENSKLRKAIESNDVSYFEKLQYSQEDIDANIAYKKNLSEFIAKSDFIKSDDPEIARWYKTIHGSAIADMVILETIRNKTTIYQQLPKSAVDADEDLLAERIAADGTDYGVIVFGIAKSSDPSLWPRVFSVKDDSGKTVLDEKALNDGVIFRYDVSMMQPATNEKEQAINALLNIQTALAKSCELKMIFPNNDSFSCDVDTMIRKAQEA